MGQAEKIAIQFAGASINGAADFHQRKCSTYGVHRNTYQASMGPLIFTSGNADVLRLGDATCITSMGPLIFTSGNAGGLRITNAFLE